jgi:hypothetical protein
MSNSRLPVRWMIVVLIALFARLAASQLFTPDRFDADHYQAIASTLSDHGVYGTFPQHPTAFRPPLYPLMLSILGPSGPGARERILALHLLTGVLTVGLTYLTAMRFSAPAAWAATLVALDPILLRQSTAAMTEPLAALLAISAIYVLAWVPAPASGARQTTRTAGIAVGIAAGLVLGLACLCRPTFIVWTGLTVIWLSWRSFRRSESWSIPCAIAICSALVVTPWLVRNIRVMGHPILATTHGGYTLWLGNNPQFYAHLREHGPAHPWNASELDTVYASLAKANAYDERVLDKECYARATAAIRSDPVGFGFAAATRIARLFQPLPNRLGDEGWKSWTVRYGIGAWYVLCGMGLVAGIWRWQKAHDSAHHGLLDQSQKEKGAPMVPLALLVIAFVGVHAFYWCNMRMRAPLMPGLAIVIASGLEYLARQSGRSASPPSV